MKKLGYKRIVILAFIGAFPSINVSPINPHMHRLFLVGGGVSFGDRFFLDVLLRQRPNKVLVRSFLGCIARQRPVSNNREVFSLGSVPRTRYHGKIVLLVRPGLQEGDVGRNRHA
jgi:hypothetical protein